MSEKNQGGGIFYSHCMSLSIDLRLKQDVINGNFVRQKPTGKGTYQYKLLFSVFVKLY